MTTQKNKEIYASTDTKGFFATEKELQARQKQRESVAGKPKPFRVEFRYPKGSKHWQYFEKYEDALNATDSMCRYWIFGHAIIHRPTSRQIQMQGARGGWKKYTKPPATMKGQEDEQ